MDSLVKKLPQIKDKIIKKKVNKMFKEIMFEIDNMKEKDKFKTYAGSSLNKKIIKACLLAESLRK